MEYHGQVLKLHELLLKILVAGLPHGEDVFDGFMTNLVANIKLLHYPPNPSKRGEWLPLGGKYPSLLPNFNR